MTDTVKLVTLDKEQIEKAKKANGPRKQITHAVVCGSYGQIFGTEAFCRKYFSAWSEIFPYLFSGGEELKSMPLSTFKSTFDLVLVLINANEALEKKAQQEKSAGQTKPVGGHGTSNGAGWLATLLGLRK